MMCFLNLRKYICILGIVICLLSLIYCDSNDYTIGDLTTEDATTTILPNKELHRENDYNIIWNDDKYEKFDKQNKRKSKTRKKKTGGKTSDLLVTTYYIPLTDDNLSDSMNDDIIIIKETVKTKEKIKTILNNGIETLPKKKKEKRNPNNAKSDLNKREVTLINFENVEVSDGVCSLKLNKDISKKNEPLFLTKNSTGDYQFAIPNMVMRSPTKHDKGVAAIQFDKNDPLYLVCPGKGNALNSLNTLDNSAKVTCSRGTQVILHARNVEKLYESSELVCQKPPVPSAIYNKEMKSCGDINNEDGNHGTLVELGFSAEGWHKLIDVCFNADTIQTLYTSHTLYGTVLPGAVVDSNRPSFDKGQDNFYKENPAEFYKKESQEKVIEELTGNQKYYDSSVYYLAKGHFAPDADFLFKSWQDATYFYVNAAPQWQCINQGNWLAVERLARNVAMKLGEDLNVSTGPYGVMKLPNQKGELEQLFLNIPQNKIKNSTQNNNYKKLAVPERFWKVIHQPKTNKCIVFTSTNNPFTNTISEICKNICNEYNWPHLWDMKKGYVSCCEYEDFKNTVAYTPEYNCSNGILVNP